MAKDQGPYPRQFPDRLFREVLVHPRNLEALLRETHPDIAERLDYTRVEEEKTTYIVDDWRERDLDLLLRVPYRDGEREVLICILIEHQSSPDQVMPLRMLLYAVLFWERQWYKWRNDKEREHGTPLHLTPVIPLVFYTGLNPWNANRELSDLFDVPEALRSVLPQWTMHLWPLDQQSADELLQSSDPFWQVLSVVRATNEEQSAYFDRLRKVFDGLLAVASSSKMYWEDLARIVINWSIGKRPENEHDVIFDLSRRPFVGTPYESEVVEMAEAAFKSYEEALRERLEVQLRAEYEAKGRAEGEAKGRAEGEAKGRAEGEAKGRAEGEAKVTRNLTRTLLQDKFGELPEEMLQKIDQAELDPLNDLIRKIGSMQSLDEVEL